MTECNRFRDSTLVLTINPAVQTLEPRRAALPEMAAAVLILDEERLVEYANASAETLFDPVNPAGCSLPALFASCGATGGDRIFDAVDIGSARTAFRIGLSDGRLLDATVRSLSSGGFVLSMDDVTSYVRQAELAERDSLTGLANRSILRSRLVERLDAAALTNQRTAIIYVDLDRFKEVNDALGHPAGDALLRKVADRFRSVIREGDIVARLGGDEFAIIQADRAQPAAATALAARLVDLIGRTYAVDGQLLNIGASVGIAMSPDDGLDPDTLFKNADLALYRAKADGRACYRFFEAGMDRRMQQRRALEMDLRSALALKQLSVVYQPQYNITTGGIVGFEALVRWCHPIHGDISPTEFIPLAEEIGVIVQIGAWVLRTACTAAASWPLPVPVAVNVSPIQFRGGKIVETVVSALARAGLPGYRLELEITEGVLLDNTDDVLKTLSELSETGAQIALDDFGTGYSSLSYLRKFAFNKLKIDRSFVEDLDAHADRRAIFGTVVNLANILGMQTVAEGVESEAELASVRAEGCRVVQGFLTGRPIASGAVPDLLNSMLKKELV